MIINLQRAKTAPERKAFVNTTPYDLRFGFWGVVSEVHPESCTVHVIADNGMEYSGVRVASMEWVKATEGAHLTGERYLPPVDSYVFCLMPNGEYSSAFVLCSGFTRQEAIHADFKIEGDDAANTREKVDNSGWVYKSDYRNGTKTIQNDVDNPTISVEINQGEGGEKADGGVVTIKVYGTTITATEKDDAAVKIETLGNTVLEISEDSIDFSTDSAVNYSTAGDQTLTIEGSANIEVKGDTSIEVSGDTSVKCAGAASVKSDKDATIEAQNIMVKASAKTEIKGGQVVLGGTVAPSGKGALCALPACAFTGAVHIGDISAGA